jgi:hypothetical protein
MVRSNPAPSHGESQDLLFKIEDYRYNRSGNLLSAFELEL